MDKIQSLYDLYLSEGIITEQTSFETFSNANQDQINQLYDLGFNKGLFKEVDADTFSTAWDIKKKEIWDYLQGVVHWILKLLINPAM